MTFFLVISFAMTLIYMSYIERVKRFIFILVVQGIILFGISYFQLSHMNLSNFLFILFETLVIKSLATPLFLNYLRKRNMLERLNESKVPPFVSVIVISGSVVFGFLLSRILKEMNIQTIFFAVAISSFVSGIYFIITHLNVFTHLIGYLVFENGIFLLSLAVGEKMPMLVNAAILLDVFMSVLVIGVFINRLGNKFQNTSIEELSQLKN